MMRIEQDLSTCWMRLQGTYIERLDWKECMRRYDRPHSFFYLDPPYWETEGYGVPFPWAEYEAMASMMRSIKGKALLSINDHPQIRACFAGLHFEEVPIKYTVGGGQGVDRVELIVSSWDVVAQPAGLF